LLALKSFAEIFNELILLNYDNEILPDQWANLNPRQIESLGKILAAGSEFVDWRLWLLASSGPFPFPTQSQLLELLHKYKLADRGNSRLLDKNTFMKIPVWFTLDKPSTPVDITKPHSYDRHANLLTFWFNLFALNVPTLPDLTGKGSSIAGPIVQKLDYKSMLLYMAAVSDPYDGFLRALAVSQEKMVPKLEPRIHMKTSSFNT
jgi:hypothetical protein